MSKYVPVSPEECPTPGFHETHRYCPSCTWVEPSEPPTPNVYERFIEEVDALTIKADDSAVYVVGVLTRAVKRAQAVVDGELEIVAERG